MEVGPAKSRVIRWLVTGKLVLPISMHVVHYLIRFGRLPLLWNLQSWRNQITQNKANNA